MMNSYKILYKQIFKSGNYSLIPIRSEDRFDIMKWRNEQIYHLRQNKPLTAEDQDIYFNNVIPKLFQQDLPTQILFSYLEGDKCIGYGGLVHINWIDKNAEVSFIMDTKLEECEFHKHWGIYLDLLFQVAFDELKLHKIYTYAFDLRPHLYEAIKAKGFKKEAVLKEHCLYDNEYKDVVIHSVINNYLSLRKITSKDKTLVYEWSNDELTRANSFNSKQISFEEHSIWFDNKLADKNAFYYICETKGTPAGLIRFDLNSNKLVIGITVDRKFRGKNLSSKFICKGCETVKQILDLPIYAYIKNTNIYSIKSFEKAGFIYEGDLKINDIDSYEYIFKGK